MRPYLKMAGLSVVVIALLVQQGFILMSEKHITSQEEPADPVYEDVSVQAGILYNRAPGMEMAIGQAWGDFDNDGAVDLYVTDADGPNHLYRNLGDGSFILSDLNSQVDLPDAYSSGANFVDYDNDGWRDLYVTNWGTDALFHNEGGKGFKNVTAAAGILDEGNSKTASWGDYDADGYLDLYIANWSCFPECGRPMTGEMDHLYHNNGDGTFSDVTRLLGGKVNGAGFVASFTDFDNDGDQDIYLINDEFINPLGNALWRNDGPGCGGWCFSEISKAAGADQTLFGMGLGSGDYDNDGDVDFYFSNAGPMVLLENQGNGTFLDRAEAAGVQLPNGIALGTVFLDYDNDGWRDIYLAVAGTANGKDIAANQLYQNNGDGTFTSIACNNAATDVRGSMGVAYADYDRDGWVDLAVGNMDEGYRLYRNQAGKQSGNRWLALELVGGGPVNRDAVGARTYLHTPGATQMQEVINGSSMGAGNELTLYFGAGAARTVDITVRWPDGSEQEFTRVGTNQRYRLDYPAAGETALVAIPGAAVRASYALDAAAGDMLYRGGMAAALLALALMAALAFIRFGANPAAGGTGWLLGGFMFVILAGAAAILPGAAIVREITARTPDARLALLMEYAGVRPPSSPQAPSNALVKLGEALYWDPVISGNRDTSCATCHHSKFSTGDALSLSVGTGGTGLGDGRVLGTRRKFIPRNAPPVFNLGYTDWQVLFWDGRVSGTLEAGFNTPASDRLPGGLDNLLAAQAMFPVTSREEMRGKSGDKDIFGNVNELAGIPDFEIQAIWTGLMDRLLAIPGYVDLFEAAYPDVPANELGFQHAANALSAYQATVFTFEDSPFDRYIQGDVDALTAEEKQGALLFYGEAGCSDCHTGGLLTDQQFHNLAVPQIGPGKGREKPYDLGRARETGNDCDRYAFRTPPLRNVALTGPWMHNGSITTLEAVIQQHLAPAESLLAYDPSQVGPLLEKTCRDRPEEIDAILANYVPLASESATLNEAQVALLVKFLGALTAPSALDLSATIPASVPSGLTVGGN